MPKYNHAFTFAFEVISNHPEADDVTDQMLFEGCRKRLKDLEENSPGEIQLACQPPYDTFEFEED